MTTAWTRGHLTALQAQPRPEFPVFAPNDCPSILDGEWLWDFWPAESPDGRRAVVGGGELWFALSAPHLDDPDARHAIARIRMLHRTGDKWRNLGLAFPDGVTPGSREWSGSAIVENGRLTLYFTAAGRRGEAVPTFEQRIFSSETTIDAHTMQVGVWSMPEECFASDGTTYAHARESRGSIGTIKAFRDPAFFRDPADGTEYIFFTGSLADGDPAFNGCIGVARRDGAGWTLLPPVVTADCVNNELERPHMRLRNGQYWLFWSTQAHVFAPDVPAGPTGLYGMTAASVLGRYAPFADSGLVGCNPVAAPQQAYSWWVCDDGTVASFVDRLGPEGRFSGTLAPFTNFDFHMPVLVR